MKYWSIVNIFYYIQLFLNCYRHWLEILSLTCTIFHLPSLKTPELSGISDKSLKEKKVLIIQALSLCGIRQVSSAAESFGSTLREHLVCSSQERSEWIVRLPRVKDYCSCRSRSAAIQGKKHSINTWIYTCIYKQIFFKIYTCTFSNMEMCMLPYTCTKETEVGFKVFCTVSLHTDKILATFPQKDFTEVLAFGAHNKFF